MRRDVLEATTAHVAVHVGAGAGGTVAATGDLVEGETSPELWPAAFGFVVGLSCRV